MCGIKDFLLDLIFPRFCLGCQKELDSRQISFICETCLDKIALNGATCHVCGLRNVGVCRNCRKKTYLNGIFSAGKYEDPILREAIHHFKYKSIESLKKPLTEFIVNYLKKENLFEKLKCPARNSMTAPILAPIPLTWQRKLKRGFNQSEILAKELSLILNCQSINLLERKEFNAPQARIKDWKQRKENISGAFSMKLRFLESIKDSKIILVDDVTTSGATLEEAARVLKQAGAKEIYGLTAAKG